MKLLAIFFVLLSLNSCFNEDRYTQLNTIPYFKDIESSSNGLTDLFIMTAHDITGQVYPLVEKKDELKDRQVFKSGGLSIIKSYYDIAQKRFPNQVVFIGNGNPFQMENKLDKQIKLINEMNFDVLNIAGPELNPLVEALSLETLYPLPIFSSNIVNAANGDHFILSNQNLSSHKVIERNGIKLGIINLSDYKSLPTKQSKKFKGIYFKDLVASTIKEVKYLRKKKTNAIIVNINIQSQCKNQNHSFNSFNKKLRCPSKDPLKEYIERLPTNMIDLIIASGGVNGSGTIKGIPVIKEETKGRYLGIAKLSFDKNTKIFKKGKTTLFPPVKTCHHFYAATKDCFFDSYDKRIIEERQKILKNSAYLVVPAMFLGHEVIQNAELEKMIYKQKTF